MMKVGFLKRLESSVHSFALTLERTLEKIRTLEERIQRFKQFQEENPEIDLASVVIEDIEDEDLADALEVGKKLTFGMAHLRLDDEDGQKGWLTARSNSTAFISSRTMSVRTATRSWTG